MFHISSRICYRRCYEFFFFITQFSPDLLDTVSTDSIITFLTTFISSTNYIKNPYIRSKLVETISYITPKKLLRELRYNPFERSPIALRFLVPSLMQFYIDIEHTGTSTQFYDKFNFRWFVGTIFRYIWKFKQHRETFRRESGGNSYTFLRFTNMLINDSIFLLDESITNMSKIHVYQQKKRN